MQISPDIIAAAQQLAPLLAVAARSGQGSRAMFKRALRAQQRRLSHADWMWLLLTLQALRSSS